MNAYSLMHGGPRSVRFNFGLVVLLAAGVVACSGTRSAAATTTAATTNSFGSGKQYKTFVERQSEGDLSAEDLHQASLLTSQLLTHVNKATHLLADSQTDGARAEMDRAESLLKVVRGILPTTVVTTTVRDAQGKEVYREVRITEIAHDDQRTHDHQDENGLADGQTWNTHCSPSNSKPVRF